MEVINFCEQLDEKDIYQFRQKYGFLPSKVLKNYTGFSV
jgi:hypothetical protein